MARVVFVDDDASIRRFLAMALEGEPVELVLCAGAAEARAALAAAPACLVVTDLMMPGESGIELLRWLVARPQLRAGARLAVFSAGLDAAARRELAALDVWRELSKPVSVLALQQCVREAAGAGPVAGAAAGPHAVPAAFGGDAALYQAFCVQALQQFEADRVQGDSALAAADWPSLRRLAHSLKGVLLLLGIEPAAAVARSLEQAADRGEAEACCLGWVALKAELPRK